MNNQLLTTKVYYYIKGIPYLKLQRKDIKYNINLSNDLTL